MTRQHLALFVLSVCISFLSTVDAAIVTASDTDDDATITLEIEDIQIVGLNQQWGTARITVVDTAVALSLGDSIEISVFEDDLAGDDLVFNQTLFLTPSEVAAGLVDRLLPLIFTPPSDGPTDFGLEIFAEATVFKDLCGFLYVFDNPRTANLDVTLVAAPVPIPAAVWLFGSAIGLMGCNRKIRRS